MRTLIGLLLAIAGVIYFLATRTPFNAWNVMFAGLLIVIGFLVIANAYKQRE